MTKEQKDAITCAHAGLIDYLQFMRLFSSKMDFEIDIFETEETILQLEKQFPFLDIDNQNLN